MFDHTENLDPCLRPPHSRQLVREAPQIPHERARHHPDVESSAKGQSSERDLAAREREPESITYGHPVSSGS